MICSTNCRFRLFILACLPLLLLAPRNSVPAKDLPIRTTISNLQKSPTVVRKVELITPGTEVGKTAPKGWTNLVLKSQPRLPEDQRRLVSAMTSNLATMVFTTTAVRVEADGKGADRTFRLGGIGVGVGVRIGGRDIIVTPDTQARLGANLGLAARLVLSGVYEKQLTIRLVAVSPTWAIMDTPAFMPRGRGHSPVIMRYVFIVDAKTGKLDTFVWRIDVDSRGGYEGSTGSIEWLAPSTQVDAKLKVDLNEFRLGIPSERAFAVTSVPEGKQQFRIPDGLYALTGAPKLSAEQATRLQSSLRAMIR